MIRSSKLALTGSKYSFSELYNGQTFNSIYLQNVRWARRKPRDMPMAKSKLFYIPERPNIPEDEKAELRRLHNIYKTQMHGVRRFLVQQVSKVTAAQAAQQQVVDDEADFARCAEENDRWNQEVAKLREARLQQERIAQHEQILARLALSEQQQKEHQEKVEEIVRLEKERAKFYITPDNIDKAIEEALANPVDFNFAIDLQGNIYRGRNTKPTDVPPERLEKVQEFVRASSSS